MEDNRQGFYEFLAANSKLSTEEKKKIHPFYTLVSWVLILLGNSFVVWFSWNYAVSPFFKFQSVTFVQSVLIYSLVKTLLRGFFSVQ